MTSQDVLDPRTLNELRESVGSDAAFLGELIDEYLADAPRQLQALRESAAAGDREAARRAAHSLKGNAQTFGARSLAALCQEAEASAVDGDLAAVLARVEALDEAWIEVRTALTAVRDAG